MKKITLLSIFLITLFVFPGQTFAKKLPQAGKAGTRQTSIKSGGSTIGVFPKLRPDKKGLNVTFTNLQNAKNVSYMLVYKTASQEEAAMGGLNLTGQSSDKAELLFATCSTNNVCRYHSGIKDARLEVSYVSKNGKKYLKKFKIKV